MVGKFQRQLCLIQILKVQMNEINENNYLTEENGAVIVKCSSQNPKGPASNILKPIERLIWFTYDPLPQQIIISVKNLVHRPQLFNTVGFYCWHQYDTNPALIQVYWRGYDLNESWKIMSKRRLEMNDGWHDTKVQEISSKSIKEIKIRIIQNFGGEKVYLNQIALRYVNYVKSNPSDSKKSKIQDSSHNPIPAKKDKYISDREKTFSEFTKLTSTEKQLKKANQKIQYLVEEQAQMRSQMNMQEKVIEKHEKNINKLQETIKMILTTVQKLHKMQQMKDIYYQEFDEPHQPFVKSSKSSSHKINEKKTIPLFKQAEIIRTDSENQLSEYTNTLQTIQSYKKKSPKRDRRSQQKLKKRLQQLLILKQQKKSQLKSIQNSQTNRHYKESYGEESDSES